jgi:Flp pilus assembly CpaE family ATPase
VVCTPEIASLKNAARFLALAHELGYGDEKLKLTINRLSSGGSIPLKDIESNLRHKMAYGLPSDGLPVIEALNAGEPVVLMRPSARIARQIYSVGAELIHQLGLSDEAPSPSRNDGKRPAKTSMLSKLTRRKAS